MVAESRLSALPTDKPKLNAANGPAGDTKKSNTKSKGGKTGEADSYELLEKVSGASLVGKKLVVL